MLEDYFKKKLSRTGFYEPVLTNGMRLSDEYFMRIDQDLLDLISNYQIETDPVTFKAKWKKKTGEVIFMYGPNLIVDMAPVSLGWLPEYKKGSDKVRLADRYSLARAAARKVAMFFYYGKGNLGSAGVDGAIAMNLYIRNGFNKKDFWNDFRKEMVIGIEELLGGKESLEIEELIKKNPFPEENNTIFDLMEEVEENVKYYDDFFVHDSEIAEFIKKTDPDRYNEKESKNAMGKYVIIETEFMGGIKTKEQLFKVKNDFIFLYTLESCTFAAAGSVKHMLMGDQYAADHAYRGFSRGLAIYRKNGQSDADFWRNTCKDVVRMYKEYEVF